MNSRSRIRLALLATLAFALLASPAAAKSAKGVIEAALKKYESRVARVNEMTIVQDVSGIELTHHYVKRMVEGHPTLVSGDDDDEALFVYSHFQEMAKTAQLAGREKIEGHECDVVKVDDPSVFDPQMASEDENFEIDDVTMYLDRSDRVIRRMIMDGTVERGGKSSPVHMEITFSDYREEKGWLHPWRKVMKVSGIDAMMSDDEKSQMDGAMADMKAKLAEMPEAQRKMMESMMGDRMKQMDKVASTGAMEHVTTVQRLEIK